MNAILKRLGLFLACGALPLAGSATAADLRLVRAAQQHDLGAVRALLQARADVNAAQPGGATALAWASYHDDPAMADLLITAGARPDAANDYGITPLWLACANGSNDMVTRLLEARANANAAQWSGATPLMMCARTGNLAAVRALLAQGARPDAMERKQGQTALMWAAAAGHADIVQALIAAGADVNASTRGGSTALMFAAQQGEVESARWLTQAGADVNAVTNAQATWAGDTPLLLAAASGHEALAIFLLERGANPNAADEFGYTALHYSMINALANVAGVRIPDETWSTYLFRPDMPRLVQALLAHGANPNARIAKYGGANKFLSSRKDDPSKFQVREVGATPFLLAAFANDVEIMRMLVNAGADPLLPTIGKTTPLMMAAGLTRRRSLASGGGHSLPLTREQMQRALEAVKLCMELGADVNAANDVGLTALHGAAFNGSDDIVRYLVQRGANLDAKDDTGQTPLHKAMNIKPKKGISFKQNGHDIYDPYNEWPNTVALLLSLGATPVRDPVVKQASTATLQATQ